MPALPDPPDDSEDVDAHETTLQFESDPNTLVQEIEKAKEQEACLIVIRGKPQGHRFFLTRDEMIIGRDPAADVYIADDGISRRHAKLTRLDGLILLSDLGSANGTYLNDQRVAGTGLPLAKEDMLRIGTSILKFLPAGELEIIFYGNLGAAAHTDALTGIYNKGYFMEALSA